MQCNQARLLWHYDRSLMDDDLPVLYRDSVREVVGRDFKTHDSNDVVLEVTMIWEEREDSGSTNVLLYESAYGGRDGELGAGWCFAGYELCNREMFGEEKVTNGCSAC